MSKNLHRVMKRSLIFLWGSIILAEINISTYDTQWAYIHFFYHLYTYSKMEASANLLIFNLR